MTADAKLLHAIEQSGADLRSRVFDVIGAMIALDLGAPTKDDVNLIGRFVAYAMIRLEADEQDSQVDDPDFDDET